MAPSLGEGVRCKVGQGYMGHTPTKFGGSRWSDSHTGTKEVNATKRERGKRVTRTKKRNKRLKKDPTAKTKKMFCSKASGGIDLDTFPKGPKARPLDQKYAFHRATRLIDVPQSSYLPYTLKMISAK
jgi:hypothetical protein